ncbi:MAG TPA: hypothetical protein PLA68_12705 [Panacibacter sp.]|nr:hypothetical protein [Panacibacter sp.]
MKNLLLVLSFFCFHFVHAQSITARVIDGLNNKPLGYAIVLYNHQQKVIYTDINGYFSLQTDSLMSNDSVAVAFLGFIKFVIAAKDFKDGMVIKMVPDMQNLQPVVVTSCRKTETYTLNKKTGRIKQYIGPGPETRLIIMSRYDNISGIHGYLTKLSILIDEKSPNMQVPVRLRWYEWNVDAHAPGKELTDTSILVYPYRQGWNDFDLPAKTIACPKDWLVFGLEFIYTPEYKNQFDLLKANAEKVKWLSDMQNRWSLSMQYVTDEDDCGFYIVNNGDITRYEKKYDRYFIRPALKFTVEVCVE